MSVHVNPDPKPRIHRTDPCGTWEERATQLWQLLEDIKDQAEMFPEATGATFKAAVLRIVEQRGPIGVVGLVGVPAVVRKDLSGKNGWG